MIEFLNKPIKNIKIKNILFYFFLFLNFILISATIFGYFLNKKYQIYDENLNIIFKNISFSNGELIHNLYYNKEYFTKNYNIIFYLQKTPAIPFFIYFLSLISKNFYFIIISKNIIIFSLYFFIVYRISINYNKCILFFLLILSVPIFLPYNFIVALNFEYEDCLIAIFLPLLFLFLISNDNAKYSWISFFVFSLYFVKTSMLLIIVIIPLMILILEKKSYTKFFPIVFAIVAILLWGFYGLKKTSKFPIFQSSSSINSYVMTFSLNENFHLYYPNKSTDLIPVLSDIPQEVDDEWKFFEYYKKKNDEYLKKNYTRYLKDLIIKIKFIFFGIHKDGVHPDKNGKFQNDIRFSQLLSKILFNISIILAFIQIFNNFKSIKNIKTEIYFVSLVFLSLMPHIVVWATSKHLVGIINVSIVYLIIYFFKNKEL